MSYAYRSRSPSWRSRFPEVSSRWRSHSGRHEPQSHTQTHAKRARWTARWLRRKLQSRTTENALTRINGVGLAGIEPATSALSVLRSNQLSYSPGNRCTTLHHGCTAGQRTAGPFSRQADRSLRTGHLARHGGHGSHRVAAVEVHDSHTGGVPALGHDIPDGRADDHPGDRDQ